MTASVPKLAIIDTPTEGDAPLAAYILAVMIYPDETNKQLHLLETIALQGSTYSAPLFLENALKEGLQPAAMPFAGDDREVIIDKGVLAAHILLLPLVMAARHQKIIGRRASMCAAKIWLTQKKLKGVSLRNIEKVWAKYQSVAHLWGAFLMAKEVPTEDRPMRAWLAAADELREMAEAHKHLNSRWPLVEPGVMWSLPDGFLPPIKFGLDLSAVELPKELIEATLGA